MSRRPNPQQRQQIDSDSIILRPLSGILKTMANFYDDPRLANVEIGRMIKCRDCGVNAFAARYSNKQLNDYKRELLNARHGKTPTLPRCINCTPGSVLELRCTVCRQTKPREEFSNNARNHPDQARCRSCVQASEDLVPNLEEAVMEENIREEYESQRNESSIANMSSHGSTFTSLSYTPSEDGTQISSHDGVYQADERDSAWGGSRHNRSSSISDESSYTNSTMQSTQFSAPGSGAGYSRGGNSTRGGFSRTGAYRAPVHDRVLDQVRREEIQGQRTQVNQQARGSANLRDDSDEEEDSDFEL